MTGNFLIYNLLIHPKIRDSNFFVYLYNNIWDYSSFYPNYQWTDNLSED